MVVIKTNDNKRNEREFKMTIIQSRCFKCHAALELEDARKLGLGPDCANNVRLAFEADKAANGGAAISGDAIFNLLAVFGNDASCEAAKEVALGLINANTFTDVSWNVMAGCFTLARTLREHGNEAAVTLIFAAMRELCPRMTAMSLGEASTAEALLDFDTEAGVVTLSATTVRQGSEELCKVAGVKRFGYRQWSFPLRGVLAVQAIASIRWPFAKVTAEFEAACVKCAALPALPPAPALFESYLATDFHVVTYFKSSLTTTTGDELFAFFRNEIGAAWYGKVATEKRCCAFLVPSERMEEVTAKLTAATAPRITAPRGISAARRAYR